MVLQSIRQLVDFKILSGGIRNSRATGFTGNLLGDNVKVGSRTFDVSQIQQMIPRLEDAIQKRDEDIRRQRDTVESQQKRIAELEASVELFKTECDKLRCVLAQKATTNSIYEGDTNEWTEEVAEQAETLFEPDDVTKKAPPRPKKLAVSAEPTTAAQKKVVLKHYAKTAGSKQLIRDAVQKNDFLRCLAKEQVIELVECMYEKRMVKDEWIIREGEPGYRLFVVADGQVRISKGGVTLSVLKPPVVIGELAILYNCERTASVQAITDVTLWVLERSIYKTITMRIGMERHSELMAFLHKVSLVKSLDEDKISKLADALDQDYYAGGSYIVREGERGDTFFIINSGRVRVTQHCDGEVEPREIRILSKGDYFGEKALLGEEVMFRWVEIHFIFA
ncbi:unnamed protein product [Toxocara canis]|uniref:cGMP-dependent protein kinase n=1 Tax=Toxocara canis TaxID=6265 RepID=A0A183UU99_TOXCA|nr:unnamed protein product [Toxocara canis]